MPPLAKAAKARGRRLPGLTSRIPIIPETFTLSDTQAYLLEHKGEFDTMDYIYVTDSDSALLGVFSIKELYRNLLSTNVRSLVAKSPPVTATINTDPEEIAYLALSHGIKAVPVVDPQGRLLGIIPHDAINKTLYRELREDIFKISGVSREHQNVDSILEISLLRSVRHRLPWLIVGIGGGLAIAQIIGQFEETLSQNLVLVAFIPLVVYIAAAVGTQMEAFVIRDFALFRSLDFKRYFARHFITVVIIAVALGAVMAGVGFFLYRHPRIAFVLGFAVAASTMSALFSGLIVPYIFRKLNLDPANASGPMGTIIQDALSISIYFTIATLLL